MGKVRQRAVLCIQHARWGHQDVHISRLLTPSFYPDTAKATHWSLPDPGQELHTCPHGLYSAPLGAFGDMTSFEGPSLPVWAMGDWAGLKPFLLGRQDRRYLEGLSFQWMGGDCGVPGRGFPVLTSQGCGNLWFESQTDLSLNSEFLPFLSCVTMGKWIHFFEPQFSHLWDEK